MRGAKVGSRWSPASIVITILTVALILATLAIPLASVLALGLQQSRSLSNAPASSHLREGNFLVASAFDSALNSHDSGGALALFSDSAVVSDLSNIACIPGPPPFCGGFDVFNTRVQIRGWLEQLVKEDVLVKEVGAFNVTGDSVSWTLEITVNEYRRLNVAPLTANAQALVHSARIDSLSIRLTQESTTKLALGYSSSQRTPYSFLASGISLGVFALGLVFPSAAIYYISRVKRLFATVPMLDKPWILLGAGVGSLLVSLLLQALRDVIGMSTGTADALFITILAVCSFFVMSAMVLMKRAIVGEPDE